MPGVDARQEQQVIDHAGQAVSLVEQHRKFVINLGVEIFARQQCFETGAKNGDRRLQLVRGVSGITCRSFQLLAG